MYVHIGSFAQTALKKSIVAKRLSFNSRRAVYKLLVRLTAPNFEQSVEELRSKKPFLVTSTGRTGTVWLADLLDKAEGACVMHEPMIKEQYDHAQALMRPETTIPYLRDFRLRDMALRARGSGASRYGEVNSALRRHIVALQKLVPEFRIVHLVRDGRDVVTSVLNRARLTEKDMVYKSMAKPPYNIPPAEWSAMDRFEQICWLWANENMFMRENVEYSARFEDIMSSFSCFESQILKPLELSVGESIWMESVERPLNATASKKHGGYSTWSEAQKETFWRICGNEMKVHGYSE